MENHLHNISYKGICESLPPFFREFAVEQNYHLYTAQDHAVWRYIMTQNCHFLKSHAHPSYIDGLKRTGIGIEKIPHIDEMNEALSKIGWTAIIVEGFIPPAVFMDFQAHRILPISADIRVLNNLIYTPSPDIVHEAAGHAPILVNEEYGQFVQKVGEYGAKALSNKKDREVYEAIRYLSIIKEYPHADPNEVKRAEEDLKLKSKKCMEDAELSEAALIARFHWWTVEYGLIGTPENYTQIGAGLLSSVGESQSCLDPKVKKIPLSLDCINYNYDITCKQPQLFVARDFAHLSEVLEEFADTMSFRIKAKRGAKDNNNNASRALTKAIQSEQVVTVVYDTGIQISGIVNSFLSDELGNPTYLKMAGAEGCALAYENQELPGHGTNYHSHGFSSPIGKRQGQTQDERDITAGKEYQLEFESGVVVRGYLKHIEKRHGKNIIFSFANCLVTSPKGDVLFDPEWGTYDMAVGTEIISVFAGSADKKTFNIYQERSPHNPIRVQYSEKEQQIHKLYQEIRDLRGLYNQREHNDYHDELFAKLESLYQKVIIHAPLHWILYYELLEFFYHSDHKAHHLKENLFLELNKLRQYSPDFKILIDNAFTVINEKNR